ncbi:hypothetical protein [Paraurantiacibacter namhicola]|uniref:Uncharacterized protein n=1 Tax=Paraurantiacibacter namhicola TaxID=645517 RepID=A0A1C7DB23_9SPHN|nr:hypothetical protein [Paraurantiacibacter namhicola]ANU08686.1 hypothetical protein A6F65_02405 [Paraurantiacibacter namhicola]
MFTQLQTPLPVHVLEKGSGMAFAVVDYGVEHDLIWVTALDDGGEIWCVPNPKIRMAANWTIGRAKAEAGDTNLPGGNDKERHTT